MSKIPVKIVTAGDGTYGGPISNWRDFPGEDIKLWDVATDVQPVPMTAADYIRAKATQDDARVVPTGLPALPISLTDVSSTGVVEYAPQSAIDALILAHPTLYNATRIYLKPSTGNDSNSGLTEALAVATLNRAFRTATSAASVVVCLEDCVLEPNDVRSTDASQTAQQVKILDANGFNVILRSTVGGVNLATQTWTQDGTNTNCGRVDLSATYTSNAAITRVLRTDQTETVAGVSEPVQLEKFASAAAANAASSGWFWDSVGKILWVNLGGVNVEANKAVLKGLSLNTGGNSRILASGGICGLKGVRLEGVQLVSLDASSRPIGFWMHDCRQMWSYNKGFDGTQTYRYVATDTVVYASQADNANGFAISAIGDGLIQTAGCSFLNSGDVRVFADDGSLQGISAHGGVHHVSFGTTFSNNNGQAVADTCGASRADVSWLVGCELGPAAAGINAPHVTAGSVAASASRKMYLDSCTFGAVVTGNDLEEATNGTIYTYNTTPRSGSTPDPYLPDAPP